MSRIPAPVWRKRLRKLLVSAALVAITGAALTFSGCDSRENPLAPYGADRELQILRVTQSYTPEVQWVGGRVAAVGINRGERAALDNTLVWLRRSDGNDVGSPINMLTDGDAEAVASYGGIAADALEDDTVYTLWLATEEGLEGIADPASLTPFDFVSTPVMLDLELVGLPRGGVDVELTVRRDETLTDGVRYVIDWAPAVPFRRIALNQNAASASFMNLAWHVVLPDDEPDSILPPVIIGVTPPGAEEAAEWPGDFNSGEDAVNYMLWMVTSEWAGNWGLRPDGMAGLLIQRRNFE